MSEELRLEMLVNLEAERALLGALLSDREVIVIISSLLIPDDFSLQKHAWVYAAIVDCYQRRTPPDLINVSSYLQQQVVQGTHQLDMIGGMHYLVSLTDGYFIGVHAEGYAEEIRRLATLRRLVEAGGKVRALALNQTGNDEATIHATAQATVDAVFRTTAADKGGMVEAVNEVYRELKDTDDVPLVESGLDDFDATFGGFRKGGLTVVAARPSVGKTAFALQLFHNIQQMGLCPHFFSLEMARTELVKRLLANRLNINGTVFFNQALSALQQDDAIGDRVVKMLGSFSNLPGKIYDTRRAGAQIRTAAGIRSLAMRDHHLTGCDVVIVDYVQLLKGESSRRNDNREQEVANISRTLKQLAQEMNIPVIALAQLNREVERRTSHVPMLSDLRESGALEQDADMVIFPHRPSLYDATKPDTLMELYIAKNRNGPVNRVEVYANLATGRIANLSRGRAVEGY